MSQSANIEAQYARTLEVRRTAEKSTIELRRGGALMPSARVKIRELVEKLGYDIVRVALRVLWDKWAYCQPRVAVSALMGEPKGVQ